MSKRNKRKCFSFFESRSFMEQKSSYEVKPACILLASPIPGWGTSPSPIDQEFRKEF
jgi:hypothetical protein